MRKQAAKQKAKSCGNLAEKASGSEDDADAEGESESDVDTENGESNSADQAQKTSSKSRGKPVSAPVSVAKPAPLSREIMAEVTRFFTMYHTDALSNDGVSELIFKFARGKFPLFRALRDAHKQRRALLPQNAGISLQLVFCFLLCALVLFIVLS